MNAQPPLEDTFADVLTKAMRGMVLSDACVAERANCAASDVQSLRLGEWNPSIAKQIAPVLNLSARALASLADGSALPSETAPTGVRAFSTPFEDMVVNSYLVWDPATRRAFAFDTGADCSGMLDCIHTQNLKLEAVLITHTHGDHIFELDRLCAKTGAPAFVNEREPLEGAEPFATGRQWEADGLRIETRLTWGHSKGGTSFVVRGLERPVAVVGDALFAASMGGGMISYADALRTNKEQLFTLPKETLICPGHGPLTSIGWELGHNPFFADAK
jgi:glyoxylase-like metal-dependent hydrolase (beta-lactamase superfamily II)